MPRIATFTINITPRPEKKMYVHYVTRNGTALASIHYTSKLGDIAFNPGVSEQIVEVSVRDDVPPGLTFYLDVRWQLPGLNTTSKPSGLCTVT